MGKPVGVKIQYYENGWRAIKCKGDLDKDNGWVSFIKIGDSVKIGASKDCSSKYIRKIRTKEKQSVDLLCAYRVDDAIKWKKRFIEILKDKKIKGLERFIISNDELAIAIENSGLLNESESLIEIIYNNCHDSIKQIIGNLVNSFSE